MMIMLYVSHETSYDRFQKNADQIITVGERLNLTDKIFNYSSSFASGPILKQNTPGINKYDRIFKPYTDVLVTNPTGGASNFLESKMLFADADFFNFFSFKLLRGSSDDVLNNPFDLVISESAAKKYFGNQDPIGKTLKIKTDTALLYHITGVAQNAPSNSSIVYDFISPNSSLKAMPEYRSELNRQFVDAGSFKTYLLLAKL